MRGETGHFEGGGRRVQTRHRYNGVGDPDDSVTSQDDLEFLKVLAKRYIWWKHPDEAASNPRRVIAQVMNLGDWDDVMAMQRGLGDDALHDVVQHAETGQFNARSWTWWHYRLGLASIGQVPPLPVRRFA